MTQTEEIKERLNIVDIVGEYVQLKKTGANHKGLCPFHNETTPSFSVSEAKQFYYCFGCGKGGDVFSFVQEMESMEFAEVLKILAAKAHVELTTFTPKDQNEKTRLIDCHAMAAKFFAYALTQSDQGAIARGYIEKRGIAAETVKQFQLGYAPDSWDALLAFLKEKRFSEKEIEAAGLVVRSEKNGKLYDRFRGRLMFPIHDVHGNIVGFTARTLKPDEKGAKYINTPQTKIYNKSAVLYGLSFAKKEIQRQDMAVLVEGNMDVVSAHQAGVRTVVAASGTALTEMQVRLLSRYTKNIILAFDGDAAGLRAAWRGMEVAIRAGMNIRVLQLPEGEDPDDILKRDVDAFVRYIAEAQPFMDFAFSTILSPLNMTQVEDKKKAVAELLPMIALFHESIEQSHYLKRLAEIVDVELHFLQEKITPFSSSAQSARPKVAPQKREAQTSEHLHIQLQERLLAVLIARPALLATADVSEWFDEPIQTLYKKMYFEYSQHKSLKSDDLSLLFENPHEQALIQRLSLIAEEMYTGQSEEQLQKEYDTIVDRFVRDSIKQRLDAVRTHLLVAEKEKNVADIERLAQEFHALTMQLKKLG